MGLAEEIIQATNELLAEKKPMTTVIDEIRNERTRQISEEGWSANHDDMHTAGEMAVAASIYANPNREKRDPPVGWPWDLGWWKPKDRRRDLVRAAALIVAEIERLDRIEDTTND